MPTVILLASLDPLRSELPSACHWHGHSRAQNGLSPLFVADYPRRIAGSLFNIRHAIVMIV